MPRWMVFAVVALGALYVATVLIAGDPEYLIPGGILLALLIGYAVAERLLTRGHARRHGGDTERAKGDEDDWAIPSAHLSGDEQRPLGDTAEVHEELNPHDLPLDHPGRQAAERQAQAEDAETTGHEKGAQGGQASRVRDRTTERTGQRQESAPYAPTAGGGGGETGQEVDGKTSTPGQTP